MTTICELRQVTKTYGSGPSEVHALSDVSLTIEAGEFARAPRFLDQYESVVIESSFSYRPI